MSNFSAIFTIDFFYAAIRLAAPILLAAIGELMLEKAGIFNLSVEAGILIGGFFGVLGSYYTKSALGGLGAALLAGAIMGIIFGYAVISLRAHQAVVGTGLNIFASGITALLARTIWGADVVIEVEAFHKIKIPVLGDIPVIGHLLFDHTPMVYVAYLSVFAALFVLYRTSFGLKIRAIGEYPKAADTMGIPVFRYKYMMSVVGWMCAAAAGTILTLGFTNMWTDGISSSRGYYAIACVILGQWHPVGILLGSLLFGTGSALQMRLQALGSGIPTDLLLVIPMVLALLVVLFIRGNTSARPTGLSKPYSKS